MNYRLAPSPTFPTIGASHLPKDWPSCWMIHPKLTVRNASSTISTAAIAPYVDIAFLLDA